MLGNIKSLDLRLIGRSTEYLRTLCQRLNVPLRAVNALTSSLPLERHTKLTDRTNQLAHVAHLFCTELWVALPRVQRSLISVFVLVSRTLVAASERCATRKLPLQTIRADRGEIRTSSSSSPPLSGDRERKGCQQQGGGRMTDRLHGPVTQDAMTEANRRFKG